MITIGSKEYRWYLFAHVATSHALGTIQALTIFF